MSKAWSLLVYKIPTNPSRLRLQIWRKLHRMGVVYLQDAVCILPCRPDLDENMQYLAGTIAEMGGTYHLFQASSVLPGGDERLVADFRKSADERLEELLERLGQIQATLAGPLEQAALERAEEDLKRERVAYLRMRRLAYFGSSSHARVDARLDAIKDSLNELHTL